MHVQHGGASVVAIDCLLYLLVHADGNVVGVARQPRGCIGRGLNHQFFLVLGKQRVVKKMHESLLISAVVVAEIVCPSHGCWHCKLGLRHIILGNALYAYPISHAVRS